MDNFHINIVGEGSATLVHALEIAFALGAAGGKASHWTVVDPKALKKRIGGSSTPKDLLGVPVSPWFCLFWHCPEEAYGNPIHAFPVPLDVGWVAPLIERWLAQADYQQQPDHDGSNGRGWHVFNFDWGHCPPGEFYGICGIAPAWAMYGK